MGGGLDSVMPMRSSETIAASLPPHLVGANRLPQSEIRRLQHPEPATRRLPTRRTRRM
jgi:hypothetical protein